MILIGATWRVLAGNKYICFSLLAKGDSWRNDRLELIQYLPKESWTFKDMDKAANRPGK